MPAMAPGDPRIDESLAGGAGDPAISDRMADDPATTRLDALRAILVSAHELATRLSGDPFLERVLRAFSTIPEHDRETILRVIERDGTWCRIVEQTADTTGVSVRPNPHASLYVHVFGQSEVPSEPLRRDIDVIRFGIERFIHLLPLFFQEGVHEQWRVAARELARELDPELLEYVARLANEVLVLVAERSRNGNGGPPAAG